MRWHGAPAQFNTVLPCGVRPCLEAHDVVVIIPSPDRTMAIAAAVIRELFIDESDKFSASMCTL